MPALEKILKGVLHYMQGVTPARLAAQMAVPPPEGRSGQALMITCMDPRLHPMKYTDVEDQNNILFLCRNPGNFVPPISANCSSSAELAALDLAVVNRKLHHIIVCGHSKCAAMRGLYNHRDCLDEVDDSPLNALFRNVGGESVRKLGQYLENPVGAIEFIPDIPEMSFKAYIQPMPGLPQGKLEITDALAQINVLQQLENIASHNFLRGPCLDGNLRLHGMYYCVVTGNVYYFHKEEKKFMVVDKQLVDDVLSRLPQEWHEVS